MRLSILVAMGIAVSVFAAASSPSSAAYTTVDLSNCVNANIAANLQSLPTQTTTGDQGMGVPFDVATFGASGYAGTWLANASSTDVLDVTTDASDQASFYALPGNYNSAPDADEYGSIIRATNGDSATYPSIASADMRDYNASISPIPFQTP